MQGFLVVLIKHAQHEVAMLDMAGVVLVEVSAHIHEDPVLLLHPSHGVLRTDQADFHVLPVVQVLQLPPPLREVLVLLQHCQVVHVLRRLEEEVAGDERVGGAVLQRAGALDEGVNGDRLVYGGNKEEGGVEVQEKELVFHLLEQSESNEEQELHF